MLFVYKYFEKGNVNTYRSAPHLTVYFNFANFIYYTLDEILMILKIK